MNFITFADNFSSDGFSPFARRDNLVDIYCTFSHDFLIVLCTIYLKIELKIIWGTSSSGRRRRLLANFHQSNTRGVAFFLLLLYGHFLRSINVDFFLHFKMSSGRSLQSRVERGDTESDVNQRNGMCSIVSCNMILRWKSAIIRYVVWLRSV